MNKQAKKRIFGTTKFRTGVFLFTLLIIPLIHFIVFWVYVNIGTITSTFQHWNVVKAEYEWYGIKRYVEMVKTYVLGIDRVTGKWFTHPNRHIFWNSFRAIIINIMIFPWVILASYAFYKKIPHEKYFRVCFYLPSLISISVLALMFRNMFNVDFGPVTAVVRALTGKTPQWLTSDSDAMWALIYAFCIWTGLGAHVIMISGAMLRIPTDVSEYSRLEGVGFWRELVQIVLPLVMPTVGVYIIGIVTSVFGLTLQPLLIAQTTGVDNRYFTVGWYIFNSVQGASTSGMLSASTLGMILTLFMLPFVILTRFLVKRFTPDVQF